MNQLRYTPKRERELEERFAAQREAETLLDLIVAEWTSDPMSVQCFDLRLVERAKTCNATLKRIPR